MKLHFYVTFQCVHYNEHTATSKLYYNSDYADFGFDYELSSTDSPFSCFGRNYENFKDLLLHNDSSFFNTLLRVFNIPDSIGSCVHQDFITLSSFYELLYDKLSEMPDFASECSFTNHNDLLYDHKCYGYIEFSVFTKNCEKD